MMNNQSVPRKSPDFEGEKTQESASGNSGRTLPTDDLSNSKWFAKEHKDRLRYSFARRFWYDWNGKFWQDNAKGQVMRLADRTVRNIRSDAFRPDGGNFDTQNPKVRNALSLGKLARRKAMIEGAQHYLTVTENDLDSHEFLINVQNGIVDARTGEIRAHNPELLFTKIARAEYKPGSECRQFILFLNEVFQGDNEIIDYVQRALGYSLTASTREQVLFLLIGSGSNGKSTFLNIVQQLLGSFSYTVGFRTLLADRNDRNKDPEIAELNGPRFIIASEPTPGAVIDEALIKSLTGQDRITAARKYEQPISFSPVGKFWLCCNEPPRLSRGGIAMARRLRVLPFDAHFEGNQIKPDLDKKLLTEERDGILTWAINGARQWHETGLQQTPERIRTATDEYIMEQDLVAMWLQDRTQRGQYERLKHLYEDYKRWIESDNSRPLGPKNFSSSLVAKGHQKKRDGSGTFFEGIELRRTA